MTSLNDYDIPLTDLEAQLVDWTQQALALRFGDLPGLSAADLPAPESGPGAVLEHLRSVRVRLDRVEGLLGRATRARGRASRAAAESKAGSEHAWDQAAHAERSRSSRPGGNYEGARERYADWNLATLSQQRVARAGAHLADVAQETLDVIRLTHRGLESIRNDLHLMLRAIQVENSLER